MRRLAEFPGHAVLNLALCLVFLTGSAGCKTRQTVGGQVSSAAIVRPDDATLRLFGKYCSACHAGYGGNLDQVWKNLRGDAAEIASRLDWDNSNSDQMMPPPDAEQHIQLAATPMDRDIMRRAVKAAAGAGMATDLQLDQIKLPRGFKISVWAKVPGARSMAMGDDGTVYVGTGGLGGRHKKVYAVQDKDRNGTGETVTIIRDFQITDSGDDLAVPNGVAFRNGALYVGLVNRILRFDGIASSYAKNPKPAIEGVRFPDEGYHGWKYIGFGPDGRLYVPVGANGNMTSDPDEFALIYRLSDDMTSKEVFAKGVRNSVGFDWHPDTGELWFTDNGRDNLKIGNEGSDDIPPDELNRAPRSGLNFGHPFCHGGDIPEPDPAYAKYGSCSDAVPPVQKLGPHVAALGMKFYTGKSFPEEFRNQIFIAEHGSWNRSTRIGYRVSLVRIKDNEGVSYEDFASGWLSSSGVPWGRPVDVLVAEDGALLVSDDLAGVIYRIYYAP